MTRFRVVVQEVENSKFTHIGQTIVEAKNGEDLIEKIKKLLL